MDVVVAWLAVILLLLWLAADRIVAALAWIDRTNAEVDAQRAADHGEPPRAEVEQEWIEDVAYPDEWWLFDDPAFIDRPSEAVQFAATVMATIDELPGVAS